LLLHNSLDYLGLMFGVLNIGAIVVRLNFRLSGEELRFILNDSGTIALVLDAKFSPLIEPIRRAIEVRHYVIVNSEPEAAAPSWGVIWTPSMPRQTSEPESTIPSMSDGSMLMYTSGTTGFPKGALWSHGNTLWIGAMQALYWGYGPDTVAMTTGPLYHVGGFEDLVLPALLVGGHAVITRSTGFELTRVLRTIEQLGVTDCFLFPFMIYDLVAREDLDSLDLSSLRRLFTGGSPILPWAVRELQRRLPHVGLFVGYGLTEGGAISTIQGEEFAADYPDCVGRPLPFTELQIISDSGREAQAGEVGEVWVRSPSVCSSYWNRPTESAETFPDGWCRTGDLGTMVAPPGLLKITGRTKDMIKSGGENVYPAEVERVLSEHEAVKEVAVIGVPDERFQEAVCAVVVLHKGAQLAEGDVVAYCRSRLAGFKTPRHVVTVDGLPRNATGKVLKYLLREQYGHLRQ
jgi:fatty-acyl-CoA synthase